MDGTIGNISINLLGETQNFVKGMENAADVIKDFETRAKFAKIELENLGIAGIKTIAQLNDSLGKSAQNVVKVIQPTTTYLAANNKALRDNQEAAENSAISVIKATKAQKEFTDSLKSTSSALWLMSTGLQQFGRAMVTNFTVPITAAAVLSTKVFTEWEKGTLKIQGAAEITRKSAETITNSFIEISSRVPITVEELQKAGFAAAQAGVTGETALTNFAEAAVKLSKVGGDAFSDLPIDALANSLAKLSIAFGVSGENMEKVNNTASMLLAVSKAVPGGLGEVVEAMRRVAGAAKTYGVSIETTTALVGTLVASAIPAQRAGTELSSVFHSLVGNVDLVGEVLGYLGEDLSKLKDRMQEDMGGVLIDLIGRLGETEDMFKKNKIATEIFGETGKKALLPLVNNYPLLLDLQARANEEMESGALLAAQFELETNSLSGTMTVFSNNLKALGGVIGSDLAPYVNHFLKTFTEGVRNLVEGWQKLNPAIKFAIFLVGSLLAVIGPLTLLLNTLFIAPISGIITFITFLTKANASIGATAVLTKVGSAGVLSFGGAFTGIIPAIVGFTKAISVMLLGLVKVLGVIGLVAGAVYLLGKAFGIGFKLPSMPSVKLPTYGKTEVPKTEEQQAAEVEMATKADEKAAKQKEKALRKELRDKKKARDNELDLLDEGIDAYEKIKKAEIKAAQDLVDDQKEILDAKKEAWEDEKRLENEKIQMQEDILDNVKATLKASKKALNELEDTYDDELDVAENGVDFAEMNLDAAQEALKREVALGHDEFNESFRLAEARVRTMEDALTLAKENVIKVKREYQAQINAQEEIVDANQEQVDLQTDALDDLKRALEDRKAIVDKEIDVMDDELKIRQKSLEDIRENTQEKLDILKEEKDVREKAWDKELDIIQDQLDAANDYADEIAGMGLPELPELPDISGHLGELDTEIQKQMEDMQSSMQKAFKFGFTVEEGGVWSEMKKGFKEAKDKAKEEGEGVIDSFFAGLKEALLIAGYTWGETIMGAIWGKENVKELENRAKENGTSVAGLFWDGMVAKFEIIGREIKNKMQENVINPISEFLTKAKDKGGEIIGNVAQGIWDGLKWVWDAAHGVWDWFWGGFSSRLGEANQWGKDMIGKFAQGIWDGMGWVKDAINNMAWWINGMLHFSEPDFGPLKEMNAWGKDMIKTYVDGINSEIPNLESALGSINGGIGNSFTGGASSSIPATNTVQNTSTNQNVINRNYYIQPGQMIASRGEVRNFARMLKEYDEFEEAR